MYYFKGNLINKYKDINRNCKKYYLSKDKTEGSTVILTTEPYSIMLCQVDKEDIDKEDLQSSVWIVPIKHDFTYTRLCISLLTEKIN